MLQSGAPIVPQTEEEVFLAHAKAQPRVPDDFVPVELVGMLQAGLPNVVLCHHTSLYVVCTLHPPLPHLMVHSEGKRTGMPLCDPLAAHHLAAAHRARAPCGVHL